MSNERIKQILRRTATEATILATDANKTGTALTMIDSFTRRDFIKTVGLLTAGSYFNKACRSLGVDPNDSIQVSTRNSEKILPNFYDASPELNLFLTEQIFGRPEKIVDIDTSDNQRYLPQIEVALEKQWGVGSSDLKAVVVDGFKIIDHTGLSEVHYPIVWIENPEIITNKTGEPLPAVSLFVGFNPDLLYFVPPNELKGDKLMGKLFPLVFTSTETNAFAGLGKHKGTENEFDMVVPIFNYSLKDKTLKIYDPYTTREMELNVEENPIDIQKPKDVLASLVPVSAVFESLENTFISSPVYRLNRLGEITMDIGDGGTKIIPDIQVQPDGTMTFTYEGQTYSADTETLTVNGGMITFKDKANPEKTWRIIDGEWAMAELDINPVHTETAQGEFMGVDMKVNLITDKSLDPSITKIEADPTYVNQYGEKFNDAMLHFTAMTFYKVWLEKGGPNGTGPETEVSFDDYMTMWAEAQNGQRPWSDMQITILANEIATEGYDAKPTVIYPFYDGDNTTQISPTVRTIDNFNLAFINGGKVNNIILRNLEQKIGYGINTYDNNLYFYLTPLKGENRHKSKYLIERVSIAAGLMIVPNSNQSFDQQLISILSNGNATSRGYKSVLIISGN